MYCSAAFETHNTIFYLHRILELSASLPPELRLPGRQTVQSDKICRTHLGAFVRLELGARLGILDGPRDEARFFGWISLADVWGILTAHVTSIIRTIIPWALGTLRFAYPDRLPPFALAPTACPGGPGSCASFGNMSNDAAVALPVGVHNTA